jgi:excisionase family DNA binding protein
MSEFEHISTILKRVFEEYGILEKLEAIHANTLKESKPFFDISEVSAYLNISKHTIYSYCSLGVIPHFKTGKKLWFSREEIDSWVLNRQNKRKSNDEIKEEVADRIVSEETKEGNNWW